MYNFILYFGQQGNLLHFLDMLHIYFPQYTVYFIILFIFSNNMFFINHVQKFKYPCWYDEG